MSVLLKKSIFDTVSNRELVAQLEARKKCQKKLPTWFNSSNIYYPNKSSIEQTSSEVTAKHKADLVEGNALLDLTGGLGIDSYFFSKKIDKVYCCEINQNLSKIAAHNFEVLGAKNITVSASDGISFLSTQEQHFNWIYIDPSRRTYSDKKVFRMADCTPNAARHIDLIFEKSDNILIKTSPLLDISKGLSELKNVCEIHIIAVKNEVKELLWVLRKGFDDKIAIKTLNIGKTSNQPFDFWLGEEKRTISIFSKPLTYVYEPNAAIMKSGGFKTIGGQYALEKLHPNTHLYTSKNRITFPGRCFKVLATHPYKVKTIQKLRIQKANISTRNFPVSVADIRKKLHIKEGGETYLFFITDKDENLSVLECVKIPMRA